MKLQGLIHTVLARLRPQAPTEEPQAVPNQSHRVATLTLERHTYAYGLDWRFYADRKDLRGTMMFAQRGGVLSHCALTTTGDMVGLGLHQSKQSPRKVHSAAAHLAETQSQGGIELFVFDFGKELYGLTALHDSRPVAGFDQLGPVREILALAGQFQVQHAGQDIRQVGNAGLLENEETLKISQAFAQPADEARLKALPNYRLRVIVAVGVALILGLSFLLWWWLNMEEIKAAQAKREREQDPNYIYERSIDSALHAIRVPAQVQLQSWRAAIEAVPMVQNGWKLEKINCVPEQCEVLWRRDFGNYKEFYRQPVAGAMGNSESQTGDNPAQASIQTILQVNLPAAGTAPARASLPPLRESLQSLASQLQDMALLPNGAVQLKAAELYPAVPGFKAAQITKPVVRGAWSVTHELWSLNDLELQGPALVSEGLLIQRDEKTEEWIYTLTGNYYAKGKTY